MVAKEKSLKFLDAVMALEIPFFQRRYIWSTNNWEELLDNLLDKEQSHFLGSIILKQQDVGTGEIPRSLVIDGQQRLTTLSILLRAIYDSLPLDQMDPDTQKSVEQNMKSHLFYKKSMFSKELLVKIEHSQLDSPDYEKVVFGKVKGRSELDKITIATGTKKDEIPSSNILQCYKYFVTRLNDLESEDRMNLLDDLLSEQNKIIVKIDLDSNENEQAIFDTVNSSGVILTYADTIKNALFQKAIENIKISKDPLAKEKIIDFYNENWKSTFEGSQDIADFWGKKRSMGRFTRNNIEILLHSYAVIKNIFDPATNKMAELPVLYKEFIENIDNKDLFALILEIIDYAKIYSDHFIEFDKTSLFEFDQSLRRLFHVLDICDVSTFHPYILYLFKNENSENLTDRLIELETYVIRHNICGATTKNFNKECVQLIKNEKTIEILFAEKRNEISDVAVLLGLRSISNKLAALLLFWIELKKRKESTRKSDIETLKYSYSLEHLMPQKWQEFWGITTVPVFDENNIRVTDAPLAERERETCIYEIGNMTLLTSSLNTSLRNFEYSRKIEGEGRKQGIRIYADLLITKEILEIYKTDKVWDERKIRERTLQLYEDVIVIWRAI